MTVTNIMLACIAAGLFQVANVLSHMTIKYKITVHTNVTTEKRSDIRIVDVKSEIE